MGDIHMKKLVIFDLDGTVLDSSHRQLTDSNGMLDLNHWRENSTPEKVLQDSVLPLASVMRAAFFENQIVAICTARVMEKADWQLLEKHGLFFHYAMYRQNSDTRPDAEMKRDKITDLLVNKLKIPVSRYSDILLFDDNQSVLTMAQNLGISAHCAIQTNEKLRGIFL
jgi:phosphoglycolate phosphatase-like HAD superfamily hydrolase